MASAQELASESTALIELIDCSLILDGHVVLDDVSFALRPRERWGLVGPNGSGKTFLLKMLRGDVWPTPTGRERRVYRLGNANAKERIAYVGPERQDKYVRYGWNLTVEQVVTTGLFDEDIPLSRPSRAQRAKVERMLRRFSLWGLRHRRLLTLSYGQRRLTLVARAYTSPARVLLLDEVFNGLDTKAARKLAAALEAPRGGHEWVLTSHRVHQLPKSITGLAHIEAGRLTLGEDSPGRRRVRRVSSDDIGRKTSGAAIAVSESSHQRKSAAVIPLVRIRAATIYRDYRPVLRELEWTLARGEHWAILGPNGSGKSTLLSLIYGDLHPALGGTIERAGAPAGRHIEHWKRRVGWVSPELQADHFLAKSIEEVVVSGRYSSVGLNEPITRGDRRVAQRWLRFFGLLSLRDRGPRQVSYGQMRLALIARAMVNDPELLLLDEPVTGLDGDVRAFVLSTLERLVRTGVQIVMAVHDRRDILPATTHVLRIKRGGTAIAARRGQSISH